MAQVEAELRFEDAHEALSIANDNKNFGVPIQLNGKASKFDDAEYKRWLNNLKSSRH